MSPQSCVLINALPRADCWWQPVTAAVATIDDSGDEDKVRAPRIELADYLEKFDFQDI